jgi:hypothetical protein
MPAAIRLPARIKNTKSIIKVSNILDQRFLGSLDEMLWNRFFFMQGSLVAPDGRSDGTKNTKLSLRRDVN